ncbi:YALI0E28666p [Yarrowia lipolytica CLIB122]|uniref:YALI0E28666p n=2 Tax=Yarrowia lipolytica TaxID=4952 RepID=Q6C494_YARLI|nr:YALI0E28666p [Yarrowia lipolytica CLIB122]AOW06097.1 hypothetical protein YALI1_E33943g [Yarrowia lipolytica]KAB8285628.1 hypothetical protein BKA91DRAFT_133372 [Yarrowia lipolytica]KAE8175284.1 hypothetical protein BKA90DRAFT_132398 [Yarrowia lipolytica]KAJ8057494.1 hypothetical protein LXG23DRAFT_14972 [Yarrowia lipolytica]QNP99255.1 Hypothetical protein YALI2_E00571g [Yarrowia lipolytica]|eukprot:XP_504518.1 YALI0E28666p [Yarrowia lipolytica CLIB122]
MEYVIRDMEYVSGSDFEDEPLGFPGTLDSDPLPTSEVVEPVEEVNSAPSPEPETQEAPVESETTEPVLVEDVQTTQVPDLESGPWKRKLRTRTFAQQRPYAYDQFIYKGLGLDASDIRELHYHRSDDEEYEYQDQQEDIENIAAIDADDLAGLMSDSDSPDFVPPVVYSAEQAAEKRAEKERKCVEREQKRLEGEKLRLEKEKKRAGKEQLRIEKEKRRLEKEARKTSRSTQPTAYQRFFLESDDEDGGPIDTPGGGSDGIAGSDPPNPSSQRSIVITDEPEIDRMEEPKKRNKSSNPRPPKRPRSNDYIPASTAKTRRRPQQLTLDFGTTKGSKGASRDNHVLAAVRAMAKSTKEMFTRSHAINAAQKRMLSYRRTPNIREERHWLDDGGGQIGDGTGGAGGGRSWGGGHVRSRDQGTLSWSREGGRNGSSGGGGIAGSRVSAGGGGASNNSIPGLGSGSGGVTRGQTRISRSRGLTRSSPSVSRPAGYRSLPRIRDKRAGPLEHMRRAAWNQIQEMKMKARVGGGHYSGHSGPVEDNTTQKKHVTSHSINPGHARRGGTRHLGHRTSPSPTSRNGFINEYGVRVLPSDNVAGEYNQRRHASGVHVQSLDIDHVHLDASQRGSRFNEKESGEYAIRRRIGGRTGVRREPEPEPETVSDFVGLTEMIEGGDELHDTLDVDYIGDFDKPIDVDIDPPALSSTLDPVHVEFANRLSQHDTFETTFGLANKIYTLEPIFLGRLNSPLETWMCPVSQIMVSLNDVKLIFDKILGVIEDGRRREDVYEALRLVFSHPVQETTVLEEFKNNIMGLDVGDLSDLIVSLVNYRCPLAGELLIDTDKLYVAVKDHARPLLVEAAMIRNDPIHIPFLSDGIPSLERAWRSLFVAKAIGRDESDAMLALLDLLPPTIVHEDRDVQQVDIERYKKILLMRTQLLWRFSGEAILWWAKNTPYPDTTIPELDLERLAPGNAFFTVAKMVSDVYKSGHYGPASDVAAGLVSGVGLRFPRDEGFHRNKLRKLAQTYIYLMLRVRDIYDPELRPSFAQLQDTVHTDKAHLEVIRIEFAAARQTLQIVNGSGFTEEDRKSVLKWLDQMIQMTTREYATLVRTRYAGEYENLLIQIFEQVEEAGQSVITLLTLPDGSWQKMSEPMNRALIKLVQKTPDRERPLTKAFAKFVAKHGPRYYKDFAQMHPPPRSYPMPQEALWMTMSIEAGTYVDPIDVTYIAVKSMLLKKTHEPLWSHVVELKDVNLTGLSQDMILQKIMLATTSGHLAGQLLEFIRDNLDFFDKESKLLIQKLVSYLKGNDNTAGAPQLQWFLNPANFELQADSSQLAQYSSLLKRSRHESEIKNYLLGTLSISLILDGGQVFYEAVKGIGMATTHPIHAKALMQMFESLVYSKKHATVLFLPLFLRLMVTMGNEELWIQLWSHAYVRVKTIRLDHLSSLENAYLAEFLHLTSLIPSEDSTSVLLDILGVPHSATSISSALTRQMDRDVDATLEKFHENSGKWTRGVGNSTDKISLHFITADNMASPYDSVIQCLASTIMYHPVLLPRLNFLASQNPWIGRYLEQHYFQGCQVTTLDDVFF